MSEIIVTTPEELQETVARAISETFKERIPELIREATAKPWMTKEELMELTGWSSRTLQHMRDSNQIPYSKHGRKILYPRKGILEFLEEHHITPQK